MIPPGTDVPSGFEIDVTDPMLYDACGVRLPTMCESQSRTVTSTPATGDTVTSAAPPGDTVTSAAPPGVTVTSATAPGLALPPLVALLFGALLAKLFP